MNTALTPGFRVTMDDGKAIFHGVPIFAECERGELKFDSKWILAAVAEAKARENEGYLPPLHTRHHEPSTDMNNAVQAIGVFRITHAAPLAFKGRSVLAVFADLIVTDEWMTEQLANMKYPYRSVEIFDPEGEPKINGLALLDHEAPYLELPMLFAGEIDDRRDPVVAGLNGGEVPAGVASATEFTLNYAHDPSHPVLWSARRGKSAVLHFQFAEATDMETNTDPTTVEDPAVTPNEDGNFADDDDDKDGENLEGEGGPDVSSICDAIKSGEISVSDMDAILAAINERNSADMEGDDEDEPAAAPAPGADIMRGDKSTMKNFAKMQGKIDALEAKDAARDAKDVRTAAVAEAMQLLEGTPLGADLEGKLIAFHKKCGGDAEVFKDYVGALRAASGPMPEDTTGGNFSRQPNLAKEAMDYHELGGEAVDHAARFCREHDELKGSGMRASRESYVRHNMAKLGFKLEPVNA